MPTVHFIECLFQAVKLLLIGFCSSASLFQNNLQIMAKNINLNYGNFDLGMDFDPLTDLDNDSLLTVDFGDVLVNSLEKNCAEMITSDVKLQDSENLQNEEENKPQQKRFKAMTD